MYIYLKIISLNSPKLSTLQKKVLLGEGGNKGVGESVKINKSSEYRAGNTNWIYLAHDVNNWQVSVNMETKFRVQLQTGNFLIGRENSF